MGKYEKALIGVALLTAVLAPGRAAAVVKVACVGDSITYGYGTTDAGITNSHAYPSVLGTILGGGYQVMNFGVGARTMIRVPSDPSLEFSYWDTPDFQTSQSFLPDVVVLMLGTNDAKVANWKGGANTFAADCRAMIDVYAALSSRPRIFIMLPPPALLSNYNISPDAVLNGVIPAVRQAAADKGVGLIDIYGAYFPDPKPYFCPGDDVDIGDGIHPNDAGAARIAQTVGCAIAGVGCAAPAPDVTPPARPKGLRIH